MRFRLHRLPLLVCLSLCVSGRAATPDTLAYIDHAWTTLTRSMDDCKTLADGGRNHSPVLYLPADVPIPENVSRLQETCRVDVRHLPARITRLGQLPSDRFPAGALLYLPHPYVVPGGFFNEMYGWDSYFIALGLLADHRETLARGMVENFLFEVAHYGAVLNGNRTQYLSRSQPPFLGEMIRDVFDDPRSFADKAAAQAWLQKAYPLAVRDHDVWIAPDHRAGDTGLARYFDYGGSGPVPEMGNASYLQAAITWLIAHPQQRRDYLIKSSRHPDAEGAAHLASVSCDVRKSQVCADAWVDGYRLSAGFYRGDRAMRESGFDTSFRFGPFDGSTHHYAAVGLNALLYRYEVDLEYLADRLGLRADAQRWASAAFARRSAMDKYLWQADKGMYMDYDFVTGKPSDYPFVTTFYPLWAGAASKDQAKALDANLKLFERKGGLMTSTHVSGAQWDAPYGWAPTNWLAVAGLDKYGFHADARRIARKFTATIDRGLADDGTIREKYNMVTGSAKVNITAGYTANVIGFGWTNGVYVKMRQLLDEAKARPDRTQGER
ncbi:MAG: trehalase family glycosidase [Rudaea sp.]